MEYYFSINIHNFYNIIYNIHNSIIFTIYCDSYVAQDICFSIRGGYNQLPQSKPGEILLFSPLSGSPHSKITPSTYPLQKRTGLPNSGTHPNKLGPMSLVQPYPLQVFSLRKSSPPILNYVTTNDGTHPRGQNLIKICQKKIR